MNAELTLQSHSNAVLSSGCRDILAALSDELSQMHELVVPLIAEHADGDFNVRQSMICQQLECLADTCESLGMQGLAAVADFVYTNALGLNKAEHQLNVLGHWFAPTLDYLAEPLNPDYCLALLASLEADYWPVPLSEDDSEALLTQLLDLDIECDDEAKDYDLSLVLSDDVNQDVLAAFLRSAPEHVELFFSALMDNDIQQSQRICHTLKGEANLIGAAAIATIGHELESYFELCADEHRLPDETAKATLLEACDCLAAMVDYLLGQDELPTGRELILAKVLHLVSPDRDIADLSPLLANQYAPSDAQHADLAAADINEFVADETDERINETSIENSIESTVENPIEDQEALAESTAESSSIEQAGERDILADEQPSFDESLLNFAEELNINLAQNQSLYQQLLALVHNLKQQQFVLQDRRFALESAIESRSMVKKSQRSNLQFDDLELDQYDDIHSNSHQLFEAIADNQQQLDALVSQLSKFNPLFNQQQRTTRQFQQAVLAEQQVPAQELSGRLERCVRQSARLCDKEVQLRIQGSDTRIDKQLLDQLAPLVMHVLRNAVDHGIELDRLECDKPLTGHIALSYQQVGHHLQIRIADDGQGFDVQRITAKALHLGLISPEQVLDEQQVYQLILQSGFSTKEQATQVSGRGIGLDAVAVGLAEMGGRLMVQQSAELGGGEFVLTVPLRQITQHLILVADGFGQYTLNSQQIKQILPPKSAKISKIGEQWQLEIAQKADEKLYLPLLHLTQILYQIDIEFSAGQNEFPILICEFNGQLNAIMVEQLQNSFKQVIKSFGDYVGTLPGYSGITIMGDGTMVPVLNLQTLHLAGQASSQSLAKIEQQKATILVVDDSLTVRQSLKQLLSDVGFEVKTAIDGMDAIEHLRDMTPSLILTDMEMPRLNGLELTRSVRRQSQFAQLPIVMLTSRAQQKHQQMAVEMGVSHYLTKPFSESDLLDVINGLLAQTSEQTAPRLAS